MDNAISARPIKLRHLEARKHGGIWLKRLYMCPFIKRPARDACLCMGELQAPPAPPAPAAPPAPPAPPAPHFVFLITL